MSKTILVTGGARGLGLRTASELVRAGHRVMITARDRSRGEAAVAALRAVASGRQAD